jgi:hypothetical protein
MNNMRTILTRTLTISLGLGVAGPGSLAAAAPFARVQNMVACEPRIGGLHQTLFAGTALATFEDVTFQCAMPRRNPGDTHGLRNLEVAVKSEFQSESLTNIFCVADSYDRFDNLLVSSFQQGDGPQSLLQFGNSINASAASGHYELTCDIHGDDSGTFLNTLSSIYYEETAPSGTPKSRVVDVPGCQTVDTRASGWEFAPEGLANRGATSPAVVCGLEPINVGNKNGLASLKVSVSDLTGNLSCVARAYDRFGTEVAHTNTKKIPAARVHQVIDFGKTLKTSADRGYYLVFCDIPFAGSSAPPSRLHSISYSEP